MKGKHAIFLLVLIAIGLLFWWSRPKRQTPLQVSSSQTNSDQAATQKPSNPTTPIAANSNGGIPTPQEFAAGREERERRRQALAEKDLNEWRTPMNFFGRVIDENDDPVAGANISFVWTDLSPTGNSERTTTSDGNGSFSLRDTTGKNLIVKVSKPGYYEYQPSGAAFNYAGENQNFVPNANNPVLFRLRKKGVGEPLIDCKSNFRIERDGTPLELDLLQCQKVAGGEGNLTVQCWTEDEGKHRGEKYDWKCRISVPNGGILQSTNVFDFEAPLDGYKPFDQIDMPATNEPSWHRSDKRKYFLKLGNGKYGRLTFEMIAAGDHFFEIESSVNPSGSRNLEPK